jgi:hypothetical protein
VAIEALQQGSDHRQSVPAALDGQLACTSYAGSYLGQQTGAQLVLALPPSLS